MHQDLADPILSITRERKESPQQVAKAIPSYEITSQVEISKHNWSEYPTNSLVKPCAPVKIGLRAGRYRNLPVTYKTFVAQPQSVAHEVGM